MQIICLDADKIPWKLPHRLNCPEGEQYRAKASAPAGTSDRGTMLKKKRKQSENGVLGVMARFGGIVWARSLSVEQN